jgi:(heptosyl)LPS beta-1,4-glucosyltransferase
VLVLDSGSSDETVALATAIGARVEYQQWLGFAAQKDAAISLARNEWVLLLDADEWLGEGASRVLEELFGSGRVEQADAWRLQRRTHFLGKPLRFGGWGREAVERLFRKRYRYKPASVHERLDLTGARIANCPARIEHDTARTEIEYRRKLAGYALLFAKQRHAQGKRASLTSPVTHAFFYLLKNGLLRGGFLDGPMGWRYHFAHTRYVWQKYRILRTLARGAPTSESP